MSDPLDGLVGDWLTLPELGERLGLDPGRVRQLVRERAVLAVRRGESATLQVPADFEQGGAVLRGLPGLLTVLTDGGFTDTEALRWLFTPDPSLPGTPVAALREQRGTEVKRRAQALAL